MVTVGTRLVDDPGWFVLAYLERFGEAPSDTLRHAAG